MTNDERIKVAAQTYNKLHDGELRTALPVIKSVIAFTRSTRDLRFALFMDRLDEDARTLQSFQKARREHR
jgi:hypothetical protein